MRYIILLLCLWIAGCNNPPQIEEPKNLEFTSLNEGHCSYWNQDIEPSKYVPIGCWEWLDIVMDNPNEDTECILRECKGTSRHTPNVILYEGKWSVGYGWTSPQFRNGDPAPCEEEMRICEGDNYEKR